MKKYFIIAVAAIAAIAACSKVENIDAPAQKVTFQAVPYTTATKAGEVSVFGDFKNFKSRAFLHAEGVDLLGESDNYAVNGTSYQEFFGDNGETISPYNSSDEIIANPTKETTNVSYWAPSHEYYWPKSSHSFVNFVGWYGQVPSGNSVAASNPDIDYAYTNNKWTATLTWDFSNSTVGATGANLLYADMQWRYNDNPNAQYKLNGLANGYKGVPMLFHHALAQINVKAYAKEATDYPTISAGTGNVTDNTATWTITLEDIAINDIYNAGTLTLTNADPGTANTKQAWSYANGTIGGWEGTGNKGKLEPTDDFTIQKVTSETAESLIASTCVLPQDLTGATLTFNLHIVTAYAGNVDHEEIIPISLNLTDMTTSGQWDVNTKYTYYLQINPSQKTVRFDPAIETDWATGATVDQTI
ncbi:MAG: hypothetical protein IJK44_05075 [Bacteroidales bacterium]|nr:hypothetical protein [Bacteroidales bacterium]